MFLFLLLTELLNYYYYFFLTYPPSCPSIFQLFLFYKRLTWNRNIMREWGMRFLTKQPKVKNRSKNKTREIISWPLIPRPSWHPIILSSFWFISFLFIIWWLRITITMFVYYAVETCPLVFVILLQLLSRCMPEAIYFDTANWAFFF